MRRRHCGWSLGCPATRCRASRSSAGSTPGRWASPRSSEEHTSELQSQSNLVWRLLLEKKKKGMSVRATIVELLRALMDTVSDAACVIAAQAAVVLRVWAMLRVVALQHAIALGVAWDVH